MTDRSEAAGKVQIGFVGVGRMGQCAHLRNYAMLTNTCEVVAIAEVRTCTGRAVAARYGVPGVYTDADEMMAREPVGALVVSQMFFHHEQVLTQVLKYGVPVFIEKPLADTVETGERILRLIEKSAAQVMVGYHKRSDPATVRARAEIDRLRASGELGRLTYVRITMPTGEWIRGGFDDLIELDTPPPRFEEEPHTGSMSREAYREFYAFVNYYIHQINLMRFLLNEDYRVTYADPTGILLAGISDGGVACLIEMNPYATTRDWQESALVAFEHGYVRLRLPAPMTLNQAGSVEIFLDPGKGAEPRRIVPHLPAVHAMKAQAIAFLEFVRGDRDAPCGPREALADLRLAREYIVRLRSDRTPA